MTAPTITLQLTNGTDTVDLNGTNGTGAAAILVRGYTPQPIPKGQTTVTERAHIRFRDTSVSAVTATVRKAERLLHEAQRWTDSERGARVYLKYKPDSSLTLLRARVYGGLKTPDPEALGTHLPNKHWLCEFEWTRGPWEADSESADLSAAATLYNHYDGGHANYVDVAANQFAYAAPSPLHIEMVNASGATMGRVYIGVNAFAGTAMPTHTLEGETFTGMTSSADATSSSGNLGHFHLVGTTSQEIGRYAISTTEMAKFAGHNFRLLLRGGTNGSTGYPCYCYAALTATGGTTAFSRTGEVDIQSVSHELHDLGTLQMGTLAAETSVQAADLVLYARGTAADIVYVDFVMAMPIDAWAVIETGGVSNGATLAIDSSTGLAYVIASAKIVNVGSIDGLPLLAQPNRAHRVMALWERSNGTHVIADTCTLYVYVRGASQTL